MNLKNLIITFIFIICIVINLTACKGDAVTDENDIANEVIDQRNDSVAIEEDNTLENETEQPIQDDLGDVADDNEAALIVYFTVANNMVIDDNIDATSSASINIIDGNYISNTELMANYINEIVGGDIVTIKTTNKYPSTYDKIIDLAKTEQNNDERPEIETELDSLADYDTIFIGYPNWWATIPMPMFTFLEAYDFSDKTIIPFTTHKGSGFGKSISDIEKLCPNSTILDGISVWGESAIDSKEEVNEWLSGLGLN